MPRVFDCVILHDELDLLETRFREYEDIPQVTIVIAESTVDFGGNPKPAHYWENRLSDRFFRWHGKYNHVLVHPEELPDADPHVRKDALRDYLAHGINGEPHDIILHGNIDEIPSAWVVKELAEGKIPVPVVLEMRWCAYRAERVHQDLWRGTVAREWRRTGSFAGMRDMRKGLPAIVNAGTRLSLMGETPDEGWLHPDGKALWRREVNENHPRWVKEGTCPREWLEEPRGESADLTPPPGVPA